MKTKQEALISMIERGQEITKRIEVFEEAIITIRQNNIASLIEERTRILESMKNLIEIKCKGNTPKT